MEQRKESDILIEAKHVLSLMEREATVSGSSCTISVEIVYDNGKATKFKDHRTRHGLPKR